MHWFHISVWFLINEMALCFTAEIWSRIWNVAFPVSSADTGYSLFPSDTDTHTHSLSCCLRVLRPPVSLPQDSIPFSSPFGSFTHTPSSSRQHCSTGMLHQHHHGNGWLSRSPVNWTPWWYQASTVPRSVRDMPLTCTAEVNVPSVGESYFWK